ncbi:YdcF family protein [Lipingzhangella sp. LS1_29]|uniref:YdcF family protein n=1 Tax=Lipingzhangella rawalii TaxID=2055835 RepID=A0ABU2H7F2_9ACTN|nr:YdcF family protein [Lipingzhangella rawalii]MDS1271218.1 YdcF family protein [Lipingzhangella rawalii]
MPSAGGRSEREPLDGQRPAAPDAAVTRQFVRTETDEPADAMATQVFARPGDEPSPQASAPRAETGDSPTGSRAGATQPMRREPSGPSSPATGPDRGARGGGGNGRTSRGARRPGTPRRRIRLRWLLALIVLLAILIPAVTWTRVWYTARMDERPASDAILVLGASQYNGQPSPIFEARLQHAAELYQQGVAPAIVTVGGSQPGDNFTEGESGHNWLVDIGIPPDQVVGVGEGSDTLESIEAVAPVFEENDWTSAVIVTDPWHALRSLSIANDIGIEAASSPARSGPAVQSRELQLWYITRESASLMYYRTFGESADVTVDAA